MTYYHAVNLSCDAAPVRLTFIPVAHEPIGCHFGAPREGHLFRRVPYWPPLLPQLRRLGTEQQLKQWDHRDGILHLTGCWSCGEWRRKRFGRPSAIGRPKQGKHGQVTYFIREGWAGGYIKIGKAQNALNRMKGFQTHHSQTLHLLGTTDRPEGELHRLFAHLRVRGEWFRSAPELLSFIEELG